MRVVFLQKFDKDIDLINDARIKQSLIDVIINVELAEKLSEINNLKKIKGDKTAYRIRVGNYRIGLFFENEIVMFARFVHRKDIYKVFP